MSEKKIAVVTGGNRGIGLAIVKLLAEKGMRVILCARDKAKGEQAAAPLIDKNLEIHVMELDVASENSIRQFAEEVLKSHGRVDVLVNNAGVLLDRHVSGLKIEMDTVRQTLETNVYGPILLSQLLIPSMKKHGYGRIVNMSSSMGSLTSMGGGYLAYRLSKAALNAATRVLAAELAGQDILVNTMSPGWVQTKMGGAGASLTPEEGADTAIWLATLPAGGPNGGFFKNRKLIAW